MKKTTLFLLFMFFVIVSVNAAGLINDELFQLAHKRFSVNEFNGHETFITNDGMGDKIRVVLKKEQIINVTKYSIEIFPLNPEDDWGTWWFHVVNTTAMEKLFMKLDLAQYFSAIKENFDKIHYNSLVGNTSFSISGSSMMAEIKNEQGRLTYIISELYN
jgi:hypothetical protein